MQRDHRLSLIVGGFVIAGLALFALAVVLLSSESGIFTPQYTLTARFGNVQGLLPGAPVWLAGREVGRVSHVRFTGDFEEPLEVVLRVNQAVQSRIREDSAATIGTIGLLGDAYVEVSVGSPDAEALDDGDRIRAVDPDSLDAAIAEGTQALESFTTLAENLNAVVESFSEEEGGARAADAVAAVSDIVLQVKQGSGLLHSLVYDTYEGGGVKSIERSLATVEDLLEEIRSGEGLLHTLIFEPAEETHLREFLEAGSHLNEVLAGLEEGEGTLGLLLKDPTLYEDLKQLVGGAQRSLVVRSLIRMSADGEEP